MLIVPVSKEHAIIIDMLLALWSQDAQIISVA